MTKTISFKSAISLTELSASSRTSGKKTLSNFCSSRIWSVSYTHLDVYKRQVHASAYFNALKRTLTIVIPFRFTKFVFSAVIGYFAFAEVPQKMQLIGYFFIILSGLIMIKREVRDARKKFKSAS